MRNEPIELNGLYLEDSYFLGMVVSGTSLQLRALFALTQDHETYAPPLAGEQHCYRKGKIALAGVGVIEWTAGKPFLSIDPDGSMDMGGIAISEDNGLYRIGTDWFDMTCHADSLMVTLD
jgi:hypothetical protein